MRNPYHVIHEVFDGRDAQYHKQGHQCGVPCQGRDLRDCLKEIKKGQACVPRKTQQSYRRPLTLSLISTVIQLASCTAGMERCRSIQLALRLPLSLASGFLDQSLEAETDVTEKPTGTFRPTQFLILQTIRIT